MKPTHAQIAALFDNPGWQQVLRPLLLRRRREALDEICALGSDAAPSRAHEARIYNSLIDDLQHLARQVNYPDPFNA